MLAHCSEIFWGFEIWPNRDPVREKVIKNKLAKARKTRKSPGTLSLKKFGPGKLLVGKVWAQFFVSLNWIISRKIYFWFFHHHHHHHHIMTCTRGFIASFCVNKFLASGATVSCFSGHRAESCREWEKNKKGKNCKVWKKTNYEGIFFLLKEWNWHF